MNALFDQDAMRSRIESGLPTSILYRIELLRERKRWMDLRLQVNTLEVTAMYDAVARVYNVHFKLDAKLIESRTVHDLKAVEEAMTLIGPVPVFQITDIPRAWRLLLTRIGPTPTVERASDIALKSATSAPFADTRSGPILRLSELSLRFPKPHEVRWRTPRAHHENDFPRSRSDGDFSRNGWRTRNGESNDRRESTPRCTRGSHR